MKTLIAAALMIVSVSTFAAEAGSVDSLLSVLPVGAYQGHDDAGTACNVVVNDVNYPAKALSVTVSNNSSSIFKIINDGAEFRFRAYKKEYIQTDRQYVSSSRDAYVDSIIRTVIAGDNTLYVVVANETTDNRDHSVSKVECVVNL